jgi:transcriptional regulator with XRE-family HTH domain
VTAERSDDLPARVRAIRKQRGLTQQQFAEAAGVGYRSYQNFENGVHRPQPANMRLILDYAALEDPAEPMSPTRPVVSETQRAFGLAVCQRLGLDPAIVSDDFHSHTTGEDLSPVTFTVYLPTDEVIAMMLGAGVRPEMTP